MSTLEVYNPTSATFSGAGSLAQSSDAGSGVLLANGTVLLAGPGGTEIWDPTSNTSTRTPNHPNIALGTTATPLLDGRVLLLGNSYGSIYDPTNGSFYSTSMTMTRCWYTASLLSTGKVLVTGGTSSCNSTSGYPTNSAEVFDPATNSFTALVPTMTSTRRNHVAFSLYNGTVLIAGGFADTHGDNILSSAEIYDPVQNTFTPISGLTYGAAAAAGTILNSGEVLITGGFGPLNNADTYLYPFTTGALNPKFIVLGVVYSPPGANSTVQYSQTTAVGATTSISSSVNNGDTVTATAGPTLTGNGGKIFGLTGSYSQTWSSEQDQSSSYAVNATSTEGITAKGPLSSSIGVDHNYDYVLVWLNPKMNLAPGVSPENVLWSGCTYDTNDPFTPNDMDVVQLYASCLKDYYSTNTVCTDPQQRIQRAWDTSGLGGLTPADYATILARDPFQTNPSFDPVTDTTGRYDSYSAINYPPAPAGSGYTCYTGNFTYTTTSMAGQGGSDTYTVSDSFDASLIPLLNADFKATNTTTITDKWNTNYSQSIGQNASYNVCGPLQTDNYTGPNSYSVFKDNVYGTFMFYAPTYAPSSPGTITLSPGSATFANTAVGKTSSLPITLTYTAGPNQTSNSILLSLQSPVFSISDSDYSIANDTCTGTSLALNASCTFTLVFTPQAGRVTVPGTTVIPATLIATGLTNGIVTATLPISGDAVPGAASVGTINVSGIEAYANPGYATATVTVTGSDGYVVDCSNGPRGHFCLYYYDNGIMDVTVGGFTAEAYYTLDSTAASVTSDLVNALNGSGSPVSATVDNNGDIVLTSLVIGSAGNYPISVGYQSADFAISDSGITMGGGIDAADTGVATFSVNGIVFQGTWMSGSNSAGIATQIANAIQQSSASAFLQATASGSTVTLTSTALGVPTTNWPIILQSVTDTSGYNPASFTFTVAGMSGGAN